jgi:hypothetical protein
MESAIEEAIQLIRQLPDDATLEEIQDHLYVQQNVGGEGEGASSPNERTGLSIRS